jgi:hypothetical protein
MSNPESTTPAAKAPAKKASPRKGQTIDASKSGVTVEMIETMATTKGVHTLTISTTGPSLKVVTDRIRRVPRTRAAQGWYALAVKVTETTDKSVTLAVTNEGTKAIPWPQAQKAKAAAKPAAKKATAKAPAKKAPATANGKAAETPAS